MKRLSQVFRSPKVQGLVFIFLVFTLFIRMNRPREVVKDIVVRGNVAFMAVGDAGLRVVDISNPSALIEVGSYDTSGSANGIFLKGDFAYIADGNEGLLILDVSDSISLKSIGYLNLPGTAEDVTVSGKFAYIASGRSGLQIINVDDPEKPFKPEGHKDYRPRAYLKRIVLKADQAYIADTNQKVRVVDISKPDAPTEISTYNAGAVVNNLAIIGKRAYLAGSQRGLIVLDIENPSELKEISAYDTPGNAQSVSIAGLNAFVADGSAGLRLIDMTRPEHPAEFGKFEGVKDAVDLVVVENLVFLADSMDGLRAIEVNLMLSAELLTPEKQLSNTVDVSVAGGYAYLASENLGVRVVDVSKPDQLTEVGLYDTPGQAQSVVAAGDYIFVADMKAGLQVLYISSSGPGFVELTEKSHFDSPGTAYDLAVEGKYIYLADGENGLRVLNFEDPAAPHEIGMEEQIKNAYSVAVLGDYAYVADGKDGLRVVNISDRTKPALVGTYDTLGEAIAVRVMKVGANKERTLAYVADGDFGLRVIDVSDPRKPKEIGSNLEPEFTRDVVLAGNYAYVAGRQDGLWVIDISDPTKPREIGFYDTRGQAYGLHSAGQTVYVAAYDRGLRLVDVSKLDKPDEVGFYDVPKRIDDLVVEEYAYLIDRERGLQVLDIGDAKSPREIGFYDAAGRSKGLAVRGDYAYIGATNNLKIVDIADPRKPREVGSFGTPSNVTAIALSGDHVFASNGEGGLRIVDIKDPAKPASAGTFDTPGNAFDIAVEGNYAYIADGNAGLQIVNISDRNSPRGTSVVPAFKDARGVLVIPDYAYVANGEHGLGLLNVAKPAAPVEVTPLIDTPGTAMDLAAAENYLFIADGSGGIQMYYILNPIQPLPVGTKELIGGSEVIAVVPQPPKDGNPGHFYIYTAGEGQGLQVLDAKKEAKPAEKGLYSSPGFYSVWRALREMPSVLWAIVTGEGDRVPAKLWNTYLAISFDLILFFFVLFLWVAFTAQFVLPVKTISERSEAISRLFAYGSGILGPGAVIKEGRVQSGSSVKDSAQVEDARRSGPSVILVDSSSAVVLERRRRRYPLYLRMVLRPLSSLIKLFFGSPAPAADLRVVGPGLVFTQIRGFSGYLEFNERVRYVADLRRQIRARPSVQGYTRDAIEVTTNVYNLFSISEAPTVLQVTYENGIAAENIRVIYLEGPVGAKKIKELTDELDAEDKLEIHNYIQANPLDVNGQDHSNIHIPPSPAPYPFDPARAFAAVTSQAQDAVEGKFGDWTELTAHAAADVFRNLLMHEIYDNLYRPTTPEEYPLQTLRTNFLRKVRNLGVLSYQCVKREDGKLLKRGDAWNGLLFSEVHNLLAPKVLRSRGIKVIFAGFTELKPESKTVQDSRYDFWRAKWDKEARITEASYDLEAMRIRNRARVQAQQTMLTTLSEIFRAEPRTTEAMALRVFQALEAAAADTTTRALLPAETISMLSNLKNWLLPEGGEPPGGGAP